MIKRSIFLILLFAILFSRLGRDKSNGAIVLIGGGNCPEAIQWILNKTDNKKMLVISDDNVPMYWMYEWYDVADIEMLVVPDRETANRKSTIDKIKSAESILISGGVQSNYINLWKGTKLAVAINAAALKIPVAGISAGLAIMGEYYYSAENDTVISDDALLDPYNRYMASIQNNFLNLPYMKGTITDSHYKERNRHGRHVAFMARILQDNHLKTIKGIGIDEATAMCIDSNGNVTIVGNGKCYLMESISFPRICLSGICLMWEKAVKVYTAGKEKIFNIKKWNIKYEIYEVNDGKLMKL